MVTPIEEILCFIQQTARGSSVYVEMYCNMYDAKKLESLCEKDKYILS